MRKYNRIENGHPISVAGKDSIDDKLLTDRLTEQEQQMVLNWIKANIRPRKTPMYRATSYGIKHILDADLHLYLTNNQFKDAMLMCGFEPVDETELNWFYRISTRSPIFLHCLPVEKRRLTIKQCLAELCEEEGKSKKQIFIDYAVKHGISTEQTAKEFYRNFCGESHWHHSYGDSRYMHLYRYARAKGDKLPDLV